MKKQLLRPITGWFIAAAVALLPFATATNSRAEGTETLGPAILPVAAGSGIVGAGVSLQSGQPGFINFTVPSGAAISQVILYWEGIGFPGQPVFGDDTLLLNDTLAVTGEFIGGNEDAEGSAPLDGTFRADITDLALVGDGANSLKVSGLEFSTVYGAGVLVVYSDGSEAVIQLADGNDWAFYFAPTNVSRGDAYKKTVPQTFTFPAAVEARTAQLVLSFGNISAPEYPDRPSSIEIVIGGVTNVLSDLIGDGGDFSWSTLNFDVEIPAGVTNVVVTPFSRDDSQTPGSIPASFSWNHAALSVPVPAKVTGPGVYGVGFWKNNPLCWPQRKITAGGVTYPRLMAIVIMKLPTRGDMTLNLFSQLVAAKLNVLEGNDDSCVAKAITDADNFLRRYPPGSRVKASSKQWKSITAAFETLGAYNEGRLCAPKGDEKKCKPRWTWRDRDEN